MCASELLQALDEEMDRECIRGKVQLILTDPPYGTEVQPERELSH